MIAVSADMDIHILYSQLYYCSSDLFPGPIMITPFKGSMINDIPYCIKTYLKRYLSLRAWSSWGGEDGAAKHDEGGGGGGK